MKNEALKLVFLSAMGLFVGLFLMACEPVGVMELKEGVKYHLKEWPDSVYMANLDAHSDTINKVEKEKFKAQTAIKMTTGSGYEVLEMDREEYFKRFGRYPPKNNSKSEKSSQKSSSVNSNQSNQAAPALSSEKFLEKFSRQMEAIRKDPNNSKLHRVVSVSENTTIEKVLKKEYGSKASQVPGALVKYQLKSFNANVDFENLKAGDKVKVPRM